MADENMMSEPYESNAPRKKNPWPVIVIAVITLTIIAVILRLWEFVLVLSILFLLNLSWRLRSRVKATADGGHVLDYGSGMTWFAIISALVLASLFCYAALFRPAESGSDIALLAIETMGIFTILVWPLFIEGTFSWYIVNNEGIDKHSAWSRHLFMRWDEIESITFTAVNQWFVIKGNKGTIRLHAYLIGLPEFAKMVRKHVPEEKWEKARELINGLEDGVNNGEVSGIKAEPDSSTSKGKARKIKVERSTDAENDVRIQ